MSEERERELEELVLKECIVSAAGLNSESLQIGIKGDPSLRETTYDRKRYASTVDRVYERLEPRLNDLLLNRSVYRIYIGFNSGEIRTCSVFDPLREETHSAEKLCDVSYLARHFPSIAYEDKVSGMRDLYQALQNSSIYTYLPGYWQNIVARRSAAWQPLPPEEIPTFFSTFKVLRAMQGYYLRNVTLSIVQSLVRMQFNCDGTQIVTSENYKKFLEENLL